MKLLKCVFFVLALALLLLCATMARSQEPSESRNSRQTPASMCFWRRDSAQVWSAILALQAQNSQQLLALQAQQFRSPQCPPCPQATSGITPEILSLLMELNRQKLQAGAVQAVPQLPIPIPSAAVGPKESLGNLAPVVHLHLGNPSPITPSNHYYQSLTPQGTPYQALPPQGTPYQQLSPSGPLYQILPAQPSSPIQQLPALPPQQPRQQLPVMPPSQAKPAMGEDGAERLTHRSILKVSLRRK